MDALLGFLLAYLFSRDKQQQGPSLPPTPWGNAWPAPPPPPAGVSIPGEVRYHQIAQGDTLASVAQRYNTMPGSILTANPWLRYDPSLPEGATPWIRGAVLAVPLWQQVTPPAAQGAPQFPGWQRWFPGGAQPPVAPPTGMPGVPPGTAPVPPFFGVPSPSAPLPPPVPAMPWPAPSQGVPVTAPRPFYRIKIGDFGSGLAKRATGDAGRWRELLRTNPELSTYTDDKGATQIRPWKIGQKLLLPVGWEKLTEGIEGPKVVPIDEVRKAAK